MITLEEIRKDYNEIVTIMENCKTVADARRILKEYYIGDIEIGYNGNCGYSCMETTFDNIDNSKIEWFRVENYGCLDYIYFFTSGNIFFDIYDNDFNTDIIVDASIDTVEGDLNRFIEKNGK